MPPKTRGTASREPSSLGKRSHSVLENTNAADNAGSGERVYKKRDSLGSVAGSSREEKDQEPAGEDANASFPQDRSGSVIESPYANNSFHEYRPYSAIESPYAINQGFPGGEEFFEEEDSLGSVQTNMEVHVEQPLTVNPAEELGSTWTPPVAPIAHVVRAQGSATESQQSPNSILQLQLQHQFPQLPQNLFGDGFVPFPLPGTTPTMLEDNTPQPPPSDRRGSSTANSPSYRDNGQSVATAAARRPSMVGNRVLPTLLPKGEDSRKADTQQLEDKRPSTAPAAARRPSTTSNRARPTLLPKGDESSPANTPPRESSNSSVPPNETRRQSISSQRMSPPPPPRPAQRVPSTAAKSELDKTSFEAFARSQVPRTDRLLDVVLLSMSSDDLRGLAQRLQVELRRRSVVP